MWSFGVRPTRCVNLYVFSIRHVCLVGLTKPGWRIRGYKMRLFCLVCAFWKTCSLLWTNHVSCFNVKVVRHEGVWRSGGAAHSPLYWALIEIIRQGLIPAAVPIVRHSSIPVQRGNWASFKVLVGPFLNRKYDVCPESKGTKVLNIYNIFNLQKRRCEWIACT